MITTHCVITIDCGITPDGVIVYDCVIMGEGVITTSYCKVRNAIFQEMILLHCEKFNHPCTIEILSDSAVLLNYK